MDLDAAQSQLEEAWRNGWYPNSTVSAGTLLKTMPALIAELRKLREENDTMKGGCVANALRSSTLAVENEKLREETTQLDAVLLDRNLELVRLREKNARLVKDGLETLLELTLLKNEHEWIPVDERLPGHDGPVLVVLEGCVTMFESFYAADGFEGPTDALITHWREMPKSPEVK